MHMPVDRPPSVRDTTHVAKRRGRPPGVRNRPKPEAPAASVKPAAMKVAAAARYIGMSQSWLWQKITAGEVETRHLGKSRLVLTRSLDRLLGIDHA